MDYESDGPVLKVLLLIGDQSSRTGIGKELLLFPDGQPAFKHALETLHSAVPSAQTIYISLHDKMQMGGIQPHSDHLKSTSAVQETQSQQPDLDHHRNDNFPALEPIFDAQETSVAPAAGLIAAHSLYPYSKWLVLACNYPFLPPSAIQQLILEYEDPVTCFINEEGFAQPLIAIWGPEALEALKERVGEGEYALNGIVKSIGGKMVRPLRESWVRGGEYGGGVGGREEDT
jgi:molybdopterin-guanine dinucleotide biosynthesis protein A